MSYNVDYDVIIIGGGIIGSAINYELSKYNLNILQVEQNQYLSDETSSGNSGIIHGGFDAKPSQIGAPLNVRGNFLWNTEIFKHLKFPHERRNSLVLAFDEEEVKTVKELYQRGITNGLTPDMIKVIDRQEILQREPYVNPDVQKALLCLTSAVIDVQKAAVAFIGCAINNGSKLMRATKVTKITWEDDNYFEVTVNKNHLISANHIINAAGHYADDIANLAGYPEYKQTGCRGEYLVLAKDQAEKINNICFLTPTRYGKGVVVEPRPDGRVLVGPTAEYGVSKSDSRLLDEGKIKTIHDIAQKIIPSIDLNRVEFKFAGSRPIDLGSHDFVIGPSQQNKHFINVGGMQSPGIAAAPAVAEKVAEILISTSENEITKKNNFKPDYAMVW